MRRLRGEGKRSSQRVSDVTPHGDSPEARSTTRQRVPPVRRGRQRFGSLSRTESVIALDLASTLTRRRRRASELVTIVDGRRTQSAGLVSLRWVFPRAPRCGGIVRLRTCKQSSCASRARSSRRAKKSENPQESRSRDSVRRAGRSRDHRTVVRSDELPDHGVIPSAEPILVRTAQPPRPPRCTPRRARAAAR